MEASRNLVLVAKGDGLKIIFFDVQENVYKVTEDLEPFLDKLYLKTGRKTFEKVDKQEFLRDFMRYFDIPSEELPPYF